MKLYSNEIVFRGHPDKVCDQISDALLDAYLEKDANSRCGIEVMGGKGKIFISGEVTSQASVDIEQVVKRVLNDVGYSADYEIINNIGLQSPDIALGTNEEVGGAGDNGMMFGYACNDTSNYLPTAMVILQELSKAYDELRLKDSRFKSDGKAEITGVYEDNHLQKIKTFTICYQNTEQERSKTDQIIKDLCFKICQKYNISVEEFIINPTGRFAIGGFTGDTGLTGRKIVVDSYESFASVGGGAFSGKDPSKVDRSGAYMARELAKQVIKSDSKYTWCEIQISYAIGLTKPLAIYAKTNLGDYKVPNNWYKLCEPQNIIKALNLKEIKYEPLARFGHFQN